MAQNQVMTLLASASRTAAQDTGDRTNRQKGRGIRVVMDITVVPSGAPALTVTILGKDVASGKYITLLASAALAATGTTVLTVYPGLTAATNLVASNVLPSTWKVTVAVGNGNAAVYSLGAEILN